MKAKPAELALSVSVLGLGIARGGRHIAIIGRRRLRAHRTERRSRDHRRRPDPAGRVVGLRSALRRLAQRDCRMTRKRAASIVFTSARFIWVSVGLDRPNSFDSLRRFRARPGRVVRVCRARLRQREIGARFRHRPHPCPGGFSFLRQIPQRQSAGRLARADSRRRRYLNQMFETFHALLHGFSIALTPLNLLWGFIGVRSALSSACFPASARRSRSRC